MGRERTGDERMATNLRTITVGELIALLEDQDPNASVILSADYGDRAHTQQALPIRGEVEATQIVTSAYSDSGFAIGEPEYDDDAEEGSYVVIR
jgi:hypothetical protein